MISFSLDDLTSEQQLNLLKNRDLTNISRNNELDFKDLKTAPKININDNVYEYIQEIKIFIQNNFPVIHISTRCLKQIVSLSSSLALINKKEYVTFQDVKSVIPYVLKHRINIVEKTKVLQFIDEEILNKVTLPDDE
jgi:MoxR-like ATPase